MHRHVRKFNFKKENHELKHEKFCFKYIIECEEPDRCPRPEIQEFMVSDLLPEARMCDPYIFQEEDVRIEWFGLLAGRGINHKTVEEDLTCPKKSKQEIDNVLADVKAREKRYLVEGEKRHRERMEAREPQSCCTIL